VAATSSLVSRGQPCSFDKSAPGPDKART